MKTAEKIELMKQAINDPQYLADLKEIENDYIYIDTEIETIEK